MKPINISKINEEELQKASEKLLAHTLKFQDTLEDVKTIYKKDKFTSEVVKDAISIMEGETDLVKLYHKKYKKQTGLKTIASVGIVHWMESIYDPTPSITFLIGHGHRKALSEEWFCEKTSVGTVIRTNFDEGKMIKEWTNISVEQLSPGRIKYPGKKSHFKTTLRSYLYNGPPHLHECSIKR